VGNLDRSLDPPQKRELSEWLRYLASKLDQFAPLTPSREHAVLAIRQSLFHLAHGMTAAFKEWASVVDALGRGEQIFILRKGGIHEGRGGFRMEHSEFLFFPTLFHQQRESIVPSAQARFDEVAPFFPPSEVLRLEYWARVVEWRRLDSFEIVQRLSGQHIWREEVLAERFDWGREQGIYAIAVRVFKLPIALELPMLPTYGGCKSWIEVAHPVAAIDTAPVLENEAFDRKLAAFRSACGPESVSGSMSADSLASRFLSE
jgi:hypothetical protein